MFKPIKERVPIKELIAGQLEAAILNKKLLPGEKLPSENELVKQFGASRTSVREAIQNLTAQGLIRVEKGKGIFVNEITSDSVANPMAKYLHLTLDKDYVLDLVHARQILEPAIAAQAAINHKDEDIVILEGDIIRLKNSRVGYGELAKLDMVFHQDLAKATRNLVVPLLLKPIHSLLPQLKSSVYATVGQAIDSAIEWHTKILDAVKSRDKDKAFEMMFEHLKIAEQHAKMVLKIQK